MSKNSRINWETDCALLGEVERVGGSEKASMSCSVQLSVRKSSSPRSH